MIPLIAAGLRFAATEAAASLAADAIAEAGVDEGSAALQDYVKKLSEKTQEGAEASIAKAADIVHQEIVLAIRESGSVASTNLLNSVTVGSMISSTDEATIMVGSSSPYAVFVEEGRAPGGKQPPVEVIYQWMVSKGLEPSYRGAYLIAKAIAERGIPGKHPFERGVAMAEPQIQGIADIEIDKALNK